MSNVYDKKEFFLKYKEMARSKYGLSGAGEWHQFKDFLNDLKDKSVLDLGCGFGWHSKYASDEGAKSVLGIDSSVNMLEVAKDINSASNIEYLNMGIEEINFTNEFDLVLSSLALHYIENYEGVVRRVYKSLKEDGEFIINVEHPVFTAEGSQDWFYDEDGNIKHFPVDNYYSEGIRQANFLNEEVTKYHRTLTTYINTLIRHGFTILSVVEAMPDPKMIKEFNMENELRRPMMLLIKAKK